MWRPQLDDEDDEDDGAVVAVAVTGANNGADGAVAQNPFDGEASLPQSLSLPPAGVLSVAPTVDPSFLLSTDDEDDKDDDDDSDLPSAPGVSAAAAADTFLMSTDDEDIAEGSSSSSSPSLSSTELPPDLDDDVTPAMSPQLPVVADSVPIRLHSGDDSDDNSFLDNDAQDDLANNNDPNNNASLLEESVEPALPVPTSQPTDIPAVSSAVFAPGLISSANEEELRQQSIQNQLDLDTQLILRLMPYKTYDEVYNYLSAHIQNPARVTVVLNELLEQGSPRDMGANQDDPDVLDDNPMLPYAEAPASPEQPVKNKTGNGLYCKNKRKTTSPKVPAAATSHNGNTRAHASAAATPSSTITSATAAMLQPKTTPTDVAKFRVSETNGLGLGSNDQSPPPRPKKRHYILDLNLDATAADDGDPFLRASASASSSATSSAAQTPEAAGGHNGFSGMSGAKKKRVSSPVDVDDPGEGSSTSTGSAAEDKTSTNRRKREEKPKISLSEQHLYGPFNFSEHRRQPASRKKIPSAVKWSGMRHDLKNIIDIGDDSSQSDDDEIVATVIRKKTPPLVDLGLSPSPPPKTPPPQMVYSISSPSDPSPQQPGPSNQQAGPSNQQAGPLNQQPGPSNQLAGPSNQQPGPSNQQPGPSQQQQGPPPVVDLSKPDLKEQQNLLREFVTMFPETPRQYLEEEVENLVGKPAAIERFITDLLANNSAPPSYWVPRPHLLRLRTDLLDEVKKEPNEGVADVARPLSPQPGPSKPYNDTATDNEYDSVPGPSGMAPRSPQVIDFKEPEPEPEPAPEPAVEVVIDPEEDSNQNKLDLLVSVFPNTDPEFLHEKVLEHRHFDENEWTRWINEALENKGANFPSKADYEKRQKEAELLEKYSREVTVQEILDMYDDPEEYFGNLSRKVSDLYKKHASARLKREFRTLQSMAISKQFEKHNHLYYPTFKALQKVRGPTRKTRRPDHECAMPQEIDFNFLKELQFSRIEGEMQAHREQLEKQKQSELEDARKQNALVECPCCYNDECLADDMLPCKGGHMFCSDCVNRASEVAIGEGKTCLQCLGQCSLSFELSVLQKALKPNMFSKWLRKIQLAEVEQAAVDGLERCPFCEFATIMDTSPEDNKILQCQNPECGKETCRLCKEMAHIPLRCDEVEKDAEVRKRTYIENKMTEALLRKCYRCQKVFLKSEGCNKMTCQCGAQMCYVCRQPVRSYGHFYGQGAQPSTEKQCPLWTDSKRLHDSEVARGALEAKNEMDQQNPEITLKHDPTKDIKIADASAANAGERAPGVDAILGQDPVQRAVFIQGQRDIEAQIRHNRVIGGVGHGGPVFAAPRVFVPAPPQAHRQDMGRIAHPEMLNEWNDGFVQRMGQLLQLREATRHRQRLIRRQEQRVYAEFQQHRDPLDAQVGPAGPVPVPFGRPLQGPLAPNFPPAPAAAPRAQPAAPPNAHRNQHQHHGYQPRPVPLYQQPAHQPDQQPNLNEQRIAMAVAMQPGQMAARETANIEENGRRIYRQLNPQPFPPLNPPVRTLPGVGPGNAPMPGPFVQQQQQQQPQQPQQQQQQQNQNQNPAAGLVPPPTHLRNYQALTTPHLQPQPQQQPQQQLPTQPLAQMDELERTYQVRRMREELYGLKRMRQQQGMSGNQSVASAPVPPPLPVARPADGGAAAAAVAGPSATAPAQTRDAADGGERIPPLKLYKNNARNWSDNEHWGFRWQAPQAEDPAALPNLNARPAAAAAVANLNARADGDGMAPAPAMATAPAPAPVPAIAPVAAPEAEPLRPAPAKAATATAAAATDGHGPAAAAADANNDEGLQIVPAARRLGVREEADDGVELDDLLDLLD